MDRKTLSVPEAGAALGIGRSAAYEAARQGVLPTIRIGRRLLVPIVLLDRLLDGAPGPWRSVQNQDELPRSGSPK